MVVCTNRFSPEIRQEIDSDGNISLPFVGKFYVRGMTLQEAREAIGATYRPTWPSEPEFSVTICH
jgi:protein involved in polysaccharide export with SLBB domain